MSITHLEAAALKDGQTHSEKVGGRGAGTLLLVGRKTGVKCYYRYTAPCGSRPWIELGMLGREITLADARSRCAELAKCRQDHPDLKEWLEDQSIAAGQERAERARRRALEARNGTFEDMLEDYLANLKRHGQVSEPAVRQTFASKVRKPHPGIMKMKARDVRPDHISTILKGISGTGALVYRNRIRSSLQAAFNFALRSEYDETRTSGKAFGLEINPVSVIPVLTYAERAGERALNDAELRQLFFNLDKVNSVGQHLADFVRFIILIGGQRPLQVSRCTWDDIDWEQKTLLIRDAKGQKRGATTRMHLLPLPEAALDMLRHLRQVSGDFTWPFSSSGKVPFHAGSLKNVFTRFLASPYASIDGEPIPHFTGRDLRRTCKQLMMRSGIRRDLRNLLQNHGQTGVDIKNYATDPAAFLPEKRQAMQEYTRALHAVLNKRSLSPDFDSQSNIIVFPRA